MLFRLVVNFRAQGLLQPCPLHGWDQRCALLCPASLCLSDVYCPTDRRQEHSEADIPAQGSGSSGGLGRVGWGSGEVSPFTRFYLLRACGDSSLACGLLPPSAPVHPVCKKLKKLCVCPTPTPVSPVSHELGAKVHTSNPRTGTQAETGGPGIQQHSEFKTSLDYT